MRLFAALMFALGASAAAAPALAAPASAGVAFDRQGERGAFADGLADGSTGRRLTVDDPVRIASISKLVTTLGVMRLVEQHRLDLDADIGTLLGYPVRNPHFRAVPVTLRMLLSHRSSLREHDDNYVIPLGHTLRDTLADPATWDADHAPGTWFHYTNLNFPVVASLMERATGERFDRLMKQLVLDPLKLDACYNWATCPAATRARAVVLTRGGVAVKDAAPGPEPECPVALAPGVPCDLARWRAGENGALFSPQGGLRISMRGLARVGRLLLGRGTLDGVRLLSPRSLATMETPLFDARRGGGDAERFYALYGLATHQLASGAPGCADDPAGDGRPRLGHAGEAYGMRSGLWIDPARGTGIAYFVTEQPDSVSGNAAMTEAEAAAFRRTLALTAAARGRPR